MKLLLFAALICVVAVSAIPTPTAPTPTNPLAPIAPLAAAPEKPLDKLAAPTDKPAAPEAAALAALSNNLAGAINCAAANPNGFKKVIAPAPGVPAAAPAPGAPLLAAKPKAVVPPNAAGPNANSFIEVAQPDAAPAAPGAPAVPAAAPAAPDANAVAPAADAGNGNAVAAPPTTNALIKYLTGLNGGNPVTADSITALCSGGAGGAQKQKQKQKQKQVQKANQVQKTKLLATPNVPKVPMAGGNGIVANPTSLVQVFSRLLNKPVVPVAGGYPQKPATPAPVAPTAAPAAATANPPPAPQAAPEVDPALVQLHKAFCLALPKLGATILQTCPTAANDNTDVDLTPLLAALAPPSDALPPAPQKPKVPVAPAPTTAVAF